MAQIHLLDEQTIDKIAAGEVVERPASVVKELVENAFDAGAHAVTVEIKEGGIEFIRVTDDGGGIEQGQVRSAFMRHATSKISTVADLMSLSSMGFRGEALSSIAAVSKVELVTKTRESVTGTRYCLDGATETAFEEVGAPDGTTFIVRNLFFNTPVRRKFLKTAMTEASYVTDLLEHMALSRPDISFKYVINGQTKFYTNGDGDLKAIIYRIFGRDIANETLEVQIVDEDIVIEGFLGKATLNRANRNFENYFVNKRYIKSSVISKAIEEGYQSYMMQHRYPFCVLHITVPPDSVDVNVHPTKMEVRFSNQNGIYRLISDNIADFLARQEMIPESTIGQEKKTEKPPVPEKKAPEPFEMGRRLESMPNGIPNVFREETGYNRPKNDDFFVDNRPKIIGEPPAAAPSTGVIKASDKVIVEKPEQLNFFDEKLLSREAKQEYRIVGQVFGTYWIVEYRDKMLMIDQHAAHEKVKYEQLLKRVEQKEVYTQTLAPPVIINVTPKEADLINGYAQYFTELGFEIEDFGMNAFAIRGVPMELYGHGIKELFEEILTQLAQSPIKGVPQIIREKLASMACKAAVKGNNTLSFEEADKLIEQLLELDNPYNCPHGRPTIIAMSKYEVEKKFKRIV